MPQVNLQEPSYQEQYRRILNHGAMPKMTTTERDAIREPVEGAIIWNETKSLFEFYTGTEWITFIIADEDIMHLVGETGEPAFQNSWVNYGGSYQVAGFRKQGKIVSLTGLVKDGSMTNGDAIFTLPVGYRPGAALHFMTLSNEASIYDGTIVVKTTGEVCFRSGLNGYFSLDNVTFIIE